MGHYVYKYVHNNEIIYIGKNDTDLYSRLRQHGKYGDNIPEEGWDEINNSDIFYCELPNAIMSDVVESELIRRYKPKYNKATIQALEDTKNQKNLSKTFNNVDEMFEELNK